jgi:large subunit ribosomal protein L10
MKKSDKERVVGELAERLKSSPTLIVADYRGLTMPQIDALRGELLQHGARFAVVKNTLTRRAAEEAGVEGLLELVEGPTAIAFLESDGDPVAAAKAIAAATRETQVLAVRGGIMEGRPLTQEDVQNLAKLPAADVLRAQLVGALAAPMATVVGLFNAPLRDLVGVLQARIEQLEAEGPEAPAPEASATETETATDQEPEPAATQAEEGGEG